MNPAFAYVRARAFFPCLLLETKGETQAKTIDL